MKNLNKANLSKVLTAVFLVMFTVIFANTSYSQLSSDWVSRYNSFDGDDKAQAMAADKEGNIYVTGYSEGKGTGKDILTIKYSGDGKDVWSSRFNGSDAISGLDDVANAIAIDEKGNVYVTGSSFSGRIRRDFCTIKYNENGEIVWVSYFSGIGRIEDSDEEATSIAIGDGGSVYVAGYSGGTGAGYDLYAVKYSLSGEQLWASKYSEFSNVEEKPVFIKAHESGFAYVAGTVERMNGKDYFIAKVSKSGDQEWDQWYNGVGGNAAISDDEVSALALDEEGNAYITGFSYGVGTGKDFCTVKYGYDGTEQWVSRADNGQSLKNIRNEDEAKALLIDLSGNVFVTGVSTSSLGGSDFLTEKINAKGEREWMKKYNSDDFLYTEDGGEALALDKKGNIYVTGYINGFPPLLDCGNERGIDFCTIKYSQSGVQKWTEEYNGPGPLGSNNDIAKAIYVDAKGRIFVMGESVGDETKLDYCLIRYSEFLPFGESVKADNKETFRLNDNFPNPFNPTTKISFNIPVVSNVRLAIYDVSGREVALLVNNVLNTGSHQYEWNAAQFSSGTYFYKIQADGFVQTKKMLLIK